MSLKKMFGLILLAVFSFLPFSPPEADQQENVSQKVEGGSLRGHGIYVINTYSVYPDEKNSSHTFWILNLDDTFEWTDKDGKINVQSYGGMGLSLIQQKMSDIDFGFEAWGPYSDINAAENQVDTLVTEYQSKYPLAGVTGYKCMNAYFEANSPLSNQGWCP